MFHFGLDHLHEIAFQVMRRDRDVAQVGRPRIARHVVEQLGGVEAQVPVTGEKAQVRVNPRRDGVVVPGAVMRVGDKLLALAPDHGGHLGMGFPFKKAVDHMRAGAFQPPGLPNIGGLVETCFQFHQRSDRFAVFGRFAQGADNG